MNMNLPRKAFDSSQKTAAIAALISILLSAWLIWSDGVVNRDGVLYLRSAEAFANGDWSQATSIYRWPFYSWLIAEFHQWGGLSLEMAGYAINTIFFALLVYAFVLLVEAIYPASRLGAWAALTILLLAQLNDYRCYVIRDVGYWALYLTAILFFLKYLRRPEFGYALGWGLAILIATLFRIEGVLLMAFLPFLILTNGAERWPTRFRCFAQTQAVLLLGAGILLAYLFVAPDSSTSLGRLADPVAWAMKFLSAITTDIGVKAEALQSAILNKFTTHLAVPGVLSILGLIVVTQILSALGIFHLSALAYACIRKPFKLDPLAHKTLIWLVAIQTIILVVSATNLFFLTGRYAVPLALTLCLLVPPGLLEIHRRYADRRDAKGFRARLVPLTFLALMLFSAVDSLLSFGPSNRYLKEAGQWLEQNTPPETRILTNNEILAFYAKKPWAQERIPMSDAQVQAFLNAPADYDYFVIDINRKRTHDAALYSQKLGAEPIARFANERGSQILIFRNAKTKGSVP